MRRSLLTHCLIILKTERSMFSHVKNRLSKTRCGISLDRAGYCLILICEEGSKRREFVIPAIRQSKRRGDHEKRRKVAAKYYFNISPTSGFCNLFIYNNLLV